MTDKKRLAYQFNPAGDIFVLSNHWETLGGNMKICLALTAFMILAACSKPTPDADRDSGKYPYTLYRGGVIDAAVRIPIASFKTSGERIEWNKENCEKVTILMTEAQKNELHPVRFWCESGDAK